MKIRASIALITLTLLAGCSAPSKQSPTQSTADKDCPKGDGEPCKWKPVEN